VLACLAAAGVLAGCNSSDSGTPAGAATAAPVGALPSAHIHGVGIDPGEGTLLLATHDGLFQVGEDGKSTRVGPVIDLMGFAVAGPGRYLASGHPGSGVDLPEPAGLIESTDAGRSWRPISRQGESDFHALSVSQAGVLAYDGALWRSTSGEEWAEVAIPSEPAALAASPDGQQALATTQQGLLRSSDAGGSWSEAAGAPLLQVVGWASEGATVAGVDPSGQVWTSEDGGLNWQESARLDSAPQAVHVSVTEAGTRLLVVTTDALLESVDGGGSFDVLLEN
jgi:hypothetical protein